MAKVAKRRTVNAVTRAADRGPKSAVLSRSAHVTDSNIACRAYDLYRARGCEHGQDVNDWLQAERDLRGAAGVTVARPSLRARHGNN